MEWLDTGSLMKWLDTGSLMKWLMGVVLVVLSIVAVVLFVCLCMCKNSLKTVA